jgi:hypothetical protein
VPINLQTPSYIDKWPCRLGHPIISWLQFYEFSGLHTSDNLNVDLLGSIGLRRIILEVFTNVSKEHTASIFRVELETVGSSETLVTACTSNIIHRVTTQKVNIQAIILRCFRVEIVTRKWITYLLHA